MKRSKQMIAALMIVLTVFGLFLGACSKKETDTAKSTESSVTQPQKESKSEDKKSEETSATPDEVSWTLLDSLNRKVGDPLLLPRSNYISYPVEESEATKKLTYWLPLPSNVSKNSATMNETELARIWKEMTGIEVEFIHPTQGSEDEEFGVLIASGKLPDIIEWEWTTSYVGGPAAAEKEGVLIKLDDYITQDGLAADLWQYLQDNPTVNMEVKNDEGSYYCFPFIRGDKYLQCTSGPMYRSDLLKAAGYTGTLETIDDWTNALQALKNFGIKKPMVQQSIDNLMNFAMPAYKIRPSMYVDDSTGKVKYGFIEEGYKEWMLQMNAWVDAGLLDADVLTSDRTTLETYIMTGEGAVCYGAGGGYMGTFLTTAAADPGTYGADFDMAAANFPVLTRGETVMYGGASYDYATTSKASAVITADCENPELAVKFLNFAYSQKGHLAINFGEEGSSYTLKDGIPTYTDTIMKNPDGLSVAVAMAHWGRGNMSGAFVQDPNYITQYYESPQQKEALRLWNDESDSQKTLIPPVTLTEEESKRYSVLNSQVNTFVVEQRARFFTGEGDITAEWDSYLQNLKDMGVEEMISIYQAALDRYNAR